MLWHLHAQQPSHPGPCSVWFCAEVMTHTVMCRYMCVSVTGWFSNTHIHTCKYSYHGNSASDNSSHDWGGHWEICTCAWMWFKWRGHDLPDSHPSTFFSTSSPRRLCSDSCHNGCCLWTCQAAKNTKMTGATFDTRSSHRKDQRRAKVAAPLTGRRLPSIQLG